MKHLTLTFQALICTTLVVLTASPATAAKLQAERTLATAGPEVTITEPWPAGKGARFFCSQAGEIGDDQLEDLNEQLAAKRTDETRDYPDFSRAPRFTTAKYANKAITGADSYTDIPFERTADWYADRMAIESWLTYDLKHQGTPAKQARNDLYGESTLSKRTLELRCEDRLIKYTEKLKEVVADWKGATKNCCLTAEGLGQFEADKACHTTQVDARFLAIMRGAPAPGLDLEKCIDSYLTKKSPTSSDAGSYYPLADFEIEIKDELNNFS